MTSDQAGPRSPEPPWFVGKEPRPALTSALIVDAAHALVHEGGAGSLSLRALARRLDVGTSAIYRRIRSKEQLLVAVADHVLGLVQLPDVGSLGWRDALRDLSVELRSTLSEHPHMHAILDSHVLVAPSALRIVECALAIVDRAGFAGDDLVHAFNTWAGFVIGYSLVEVVPDGDGEGSASMRWAEDYLSALDPAGFPAITAHLPLAADRAWGLRWNAGPLGLGGNSFGWGLEVLLDGLEARAARPKA